MAKKKKNANRKKKFNTQTQNVVGGKHIVNKSRSKVKDATKILFAVAWKTIGGAALILGLVVSFCSLTSKVSITPDSPLNPKKLFSTPFKIKNEGLLSISSIWFYYRIRVCPANRLA
jgi:hypothetical protein